MRALRLLGIVLLLAPAALPQQGQKWIQLFNAKNLDGWTPKIKGHQLGDNYKNTFRVENGVLKVSYDGYERWENRFGHLFFKSPYSRYVIAVEYRFTGEQVPGGPSWALRNSGIMIHCQDPKTMLQEQDFPISIEVQLLGGSGAGKRTTANLCTPGTNVVMDGKLVTTHCIGSSSETFHGEQWVRVEVEVDGGKVITHKVKGQPVLRYEQPQIGGGSVTNFDPAVKQDGRPLTGGYISLQSESHPVEFRKVELRDLGRAR